MSRFLIRCRNWHRIPITTGTSITITDLEIQDEVQPDDQHDADEHGGRKQERADEPPQKQVDSFSTKQHVAQTAIADVARHLVERRQHDQERYEQEKRQQEH